MPEELEQGRLLGGRIAAAHRLDANLALQGDRMERGWAGIRRRLGEHSLNASIGTAANALGSAPSTSICRSGIGRSGSGRGAVAQLGEKAIDLGPNLRAAGEPTP